jgi:hypothetical protein
VWDTGSVGQPGQLLDLDWRRLSRWCLLGTIVMLLWLVYPVARCSFDSFRDTPIGEVDGNGEPRTADRDRVEQGGGFVGTWWSATKVCYAATPLLGQEDWKSVALLSLAGATLLTRILARVVNRRHGI